MSLDVPAPSKRDTPSLPPGPDDRLVVLDVDGLFIKRTFDPTIEEFRVVDATHLEVPRFKIEIRRDTQAFLGELFARVDGQGSSKRVVGLWTSSKATTFRSYLPYIFGEFYSRFEFIWDRQMCDLDPFFGIEPAFKAHSTIKPLSRLLNNPMINEDRRWTAANVLIVDDSAPKLRFNPPGSTRVLGWDEDLLGLVDELFSLGK